MAAENSTDKVTISIIGTEAASGGGVAPTPDGTIAKTPAGQPNLLVQVVTPTMAILVRFINAFLTSFVGLLTAAGIGADAVTASFATTAKTAAIASLVIAGIATIKNLITIFGRLEGQYPLATGSI